MADKQIPRKDKGKQKVGEEIDIEAQVRGIREDAYYALLRAFRAEYEIPPDRWVALMIDVRAELGISEAVHLHFLDAIDEDYHLIDIRERWVQKQLEKKLASAPSSAADSSSETTESSGTSPASLLGTVVHVIPPGEDDFRRFIITNCNEELGRHYLQSDYEDDPFNSWIDLKLIPRNLIKWGDNNPDEQNVSVKPDKDPDEEYVPKEQVGTILRRTSTCGGLGGPDDLLFKVPPPPSQTNVTAEKPIEKACNDPAEGQSDKQEDTALDSMVDLLLGPEEPET